jgi:hypothetical protein
VMTDDLVKTPDQPRATGETMSWLSKIQEAKVKAVARNVDPWRLPLERVRGKTGYDGLERVSSQTLLDILEVPQRSRTAGHRRTGSGHRTFFSSGRPSSEADPEAVPQCPTESLAKIMTELGWTAVRVRDLTRGSYKEHVRGYCRTARCRSTVPN